MYEGYNRLRAELEQNVKERGRRDRHADAPFATDEQLWAIGTQIMYAEFGTWAEVHAAIVDDPALAASSSIADQLVELRDWYGEGRRPEVLSFGAIANALGALGIEAAVVHDCGGTWMLQVGRSFVDDEGEYRAAVTAGPGYDVGRHVIEGDWAEFSYGTGDRSVPDGEQIQETLPEDRLYRSEEIAGLIAAVYERELARRGQSLAAWVSHERHLPVRIKAAAEAAELAFWSVVATAFPEITSGDVDPGMAFHTSQVMQQAIASWIDGNGDENTPWAAEEELPEGTCGRCGALDKTACDCVSHLCDDECGDPSHPRDGRTIVYPTRKMKEFVDGLVRRAEQMRGQQ